MTIKGVRSEEFDDKERGKTEKWILYFREDEKGLVLNKTNTTNLIGLFGPETEDWKGQKCWVGASEVDFQGKTTLSVRVRIKKVSKTENKPKSADEPEDVFADD
jgi:hypothetical protein